MACGLSSAIPSLFASDAIYSQLMQSLTSPDGTYTAQDVDAALARVFGAGIRPLHFEQALFEAMLEGWAAQRTARYLKPKTIRTNLSGVRSFAEHMGVWPWQWGADQADEYFEDLLARPKRLARSTLRTYQLRLRAFCEFAADRRYPWPVICEREFGRAPAQLFDERNMVAHLDEFEGDPARRPLTVDELDSFFSACEARIGSARRRGRKGGLQAWRDQALFKVKFGWGLRRNEVSLLNVCDFRPAAALPEFGAYGALHVHHGKAKRGGGHSGAPFSLSSSGPSRSSSNTSPRSARPSAAPSTPRSSSPSVARASPPPTSTSASPGSASPRGWTSC